MKRILLFCAITFGITYAVEFVFIFPLVESANRGEASSVIVQYSIAAMMLMPSIGALLTRLITKEGFKNSLIKPSDFRHTFKYYLFAWFGPTVLTVIGAIVYFLIFPQDFDPTMSLMLSSLETQIAATGSEVVPAALLQMTLWIQLATAVFMSPVLNVLFCFGEEWGWRGYLLPKVNERLSFIPTVLITGVIWGLWHAPLTMLGHNYGLGYPGYPFTGILAMCCFCIVTGTFFSYLTIKAKSCLPAVIGHGALNGFVSASIMFSATGGNPFIGPMPIGVIGGIAFIIVAVILCIVMRKERGAQWSLSETSQKLEASSAAYPGHTVPIER